MTGILYFILIYALRAVIWFFGIFYLPLFIKPLYGEWKGYVEMAWRNPTNGMAGWFTQPVPEDMPNPDNIVRGYSEGDTYYWPQKSASRWMQEGIYWEYWYLRSIDWTIRGKHYQWFEFRIGWKFVDGNTEFFPTIQFAPHSS